MARFKVRPWLNKSELLKIRDKLFLANEIKNITARREACEQVEIWRRRARLPHAIESTATLVQAQIHSLHREGNNIDDVYATKASLATALARFVTGFCDINQPTVAKRSMFDVAAELTIPEELVELRHQFTHGGELPTLHALEKAVADALTWVWHAYWAHSDDRILGIQSSSGKQLHEESRQTEESSIKEFIKKYIVARKHEIKQASLSLNAAEIFIQDIKDIYASNPSSTIIKVSSVIQLGMTLIAEAILTQDLTKIRRIWDPLLQALTLQYADFMPEFVIAAHFKITLNEANLNQTTNPARDCLIGWLVHIFNSKEWSAQRIANKDNFLELKEQLMEECILRPSFWAQKLLVKLFTFEDEHSSAHVDTKHVRFALGSTSESSTHSNQTHVEQVADLSRIELPQANTEGPASVSGDYSSWKVWPIRWKRLPLGVPGGEA